jgi:hypothetical protein
MYINARKKGADGSIEPERVFRDALETAKPAYLGKYNNSREGKFYKIALDLYTIVNELNRRVAETNHHEKTMDAAKLLPSKHSISYLTSTFLNWAVYNWHMKKEPIVEDLGDNGYETNCCTVCDFTGEGLFYFSTAYGLENPICENCLPFDANDYEEEEDEYVVNEIADEEISDEEESEDLTKMTGQQLRDIWCVLRGKPTGIANSGMLRNKKMLIDEITKLRASLVVEAQPSEATIESDAEDSDDDDEDYEPSNDSEDEKEEDDVDDEIDSEEEDNEEEDGEEEDGEEEDNEEESEEQSFGCTGCPYEWRAGFKHGYKTAMKEMRNYANQQKHNIPEIPECEVCSDSHEKLKKCGRCGLVRYCSEECQTEDWAEHKHVCKKA